jgi:hypothetical protein
MERIETTILRNLVFNEDYSRKVIPFIQPNYFEQRTEKVVFQEIVNFIVKYGSAITVEALNIEIENRTDLSDSEVKEIRDISKSLHDSPKSGAEIVQSILHSWSQFILQMVMMKRKIEMLSQAFFQML